MEDIAAINNIPSAQTRESGLLEQIPRLDFINQVAFRLIPSKFPPKSLFDDVANQLEFEILFKIQELTNPRARQEFGNLNCVPAAERPYGIRGCNYAMGPFVHVNPSGSRFSPGAFGVFYAADEVPTAIAETRYHQEKYYSNIDGLKYDRFTMRCLKTQFSASLRDIRGEKFEIQSWHHPDDYSASQSIGKQLKKKSEMGFVYRSVRAPGKTCYALFSPRAIQDVVQTAHYEYIWDGEKISVALETLSVSN